MCRSIKQLRKPEGVPTDDELYAAALQYIRKVSGFRKPSKVNQAVFDTAVAGVAAVTRDLLNNLTVRNSLAAQNKAVPHKEK